MPNSPIQNVTISPAAMPDAAAARGWLIDWYPPLSGYFERMEEVTRGLLSVDQAMLAEAGHYVIFGRGKRLRPVLLLLCAAACGGDMGLAVEAAALVEVVHSASLVHDDVVDEAGWRRGKASARSVWGNKVSVLLGDFLLCRILAHTSERGNAAMLADILGVAQQMCQGQISELRDAGPELSEAEYLSIIAGKTASLFGFCGRQGALCASVSAEAVHAMESFALDFGMAFQIADDIHDLISSQETSGKPVNHDLRQRKVTLPLIHALRTLAGSDHGFLRAALAREAVAEESLVAVRRLAVDCGGVDYARSVSDSYLQSAKRALERLPALLPQPADTAAFEALRLACGDEFPCPVLR